MPRKRSFNMRRFPPKAVLPDAKGMLHESVECTCATSATSQPKIVERLARKGDQSAKLCTVAALIRHKLSCVCTWKASVLDSIQEEGRKLNSEKLDKGVDRMPLDYGRSVALFHSSFPELKLYITALSLALNTKKFSVVTVRLDDVVNCGDKLYTFLTETDCISEQSTGYLLIKELPTIVTLNNCPCGLEYSSP
ncbi:hypothetical protein F7725_007315, partial [Dissostichus mawsoni]